MKLIDQLYNVPCIGLWVLFNEGWGQFDSLRLTEKIHLADPGRLVDHASGWFDQGGGDVKSVHNYFRPLRVRQSSAPSSSRNTAATPAPWTAISTPQNSSAITPTRTPRNLPPPGRPSRKRSRNSRIKASQEPCIHNCPTWRKRRMVCIHMTGRFVRWRGNCKAFPRTKNFH